jgi:inositol-hexakisphosphate kinase
MSPVAAHPGTTVPAHLNRDLPAKGSPSADHDVSDQNHASSTGSRPVPKHSVETTAAVAPPSPSRFTQSDQRRTRTAPNTVPSYDPSAAVQAGRELQHAVEPLLSERDSIFATHYTGGDAPVTASKERKVGREEEEEEEEKSQDDQSSMAIPMPPQAFMRLQSAFNKDRPVSPLSPYSLQDEAPGIIRRPVSRTGLPPQYQRRSLYDIHDMDTTVIDSDIPEEDVATPRMSRSPVPNTPDTSTEAGKVAFAADVEGSAERQQYRSWRAGKAKLEGLTIAQSQRRQSKAELGEDQVIDAQLPTPEAPAINVRSRKASHYLGLFKENEGSGRQQHVTHKLQDLLNQNKQPDESKTDQDPSGSQDDKYCKDEEETHRMPVDLLDEIRNHHHLAPGKARKISYPKALPGHDGERLGHQDRNRKATEEEDSDREHISSATYFPHQGVALGDSPTDESQQAARKARAQAVLAKEKQQQVADDDMAVAPLEDNGAQSNGDLSLCRESSNHSLENKAKSIQSTDYIATDSEYESGYSTSGSLSQASEDEDEDTTPTATPTAKSAMMQAKRKHSHAQPLEAMPAVELKPFSHQVGGHTRMYRFSRRAVCKQLNSKENMFYETIEKYHPELLGFMPR